MRFDWKRFCQHHRISFVTSGPNTARNHISIKCPFCGSADHSQHMGLSLDKRRPAWGCFRNADHRGLHPAPLIAELLGVGITAARSMVETESAPMEEFESAVERLRAAPPSKVLAPTPPPDPEGLRKFGDGSGYYEKRFLTYLAEERGFGKDAEAIIRDYPLRHAMTGEYAWRILFPVYGLSGARYGWQGRDIRRGSTQRYLTTPGLPDGSVVAFPLKDARGLSLRELLLSWAPKAHILVAEGPVDALKLDFYGRGLGFRAVAPMGTAASRDRFSALRQLGVQFVVYDSDAWAQSLDLVGEIGAKWVALPKGVKDPGEMSPAEVRKFLSNIRLSAV